MSEIVVIDEARQWLVVDKPAGLPVHATEKREDNLLELLIPEGKGLHAINRLDRDTSGIVLIAKTPAVAAELRGLWAEHSEKIYLAVLNGLPPWEQALWDFGLSEKAEGRTNPAGPRKEWKQCGTEVKVRERKETRVLVEANLLTGRKHQIRRHAALAGFPIVGDGRYGSSQGARRLALHAWKLSLNWKGLPLAWEAPPPSSFLNLFV